MEKSTMSVKELSLQMGISLPKQTEHEGQHAEHRLEHGEQQHFHIADEHKQP